MIFEEEHKSGYSASLRNDSHPREEEKMFNNSRKESSKRIRPKSAYFDPISPGSILQMQALDNHKGGDLLGVPDSQKVNSKGQGYDDSVHGLTMVKDDGDELMADEHINFPIVYGLHSNYQKMRKNSDDEILDSGI